MFIIWLLFYNNFYDQSEEDQALKEKLELMVERLSDTEI